LEENVSRNVWLPGYACESWIWRDLVQTHDAEGIFVDWPEDAEGRISTRSALATWVIKEYLSGEDDLVLIGHSMGGVAAGDVLPEPAAGVDTATLACKRCGHAAPRQA
jgi:alpha-beta hydrolase superfamily lysophospholipase